MARLDELLNAMRQRKAIGIVLVAGERVMFRYGAGMVPAVREKLTARQIRWLLAELIDAESLALLDEGREVHFTYETDDSRFRGVAGHPGGILVVKVEPERRATRGSAGAPVDRTLVQSTGPRFEVAARDSDRHHIDALLRAMVEAGSSDLHLSVGSGPVMRLDGDLRVLEGQPVLAPGDTERLLLQITPQNNREQFDNVHDTDFAYELEGERFRVNVFRDHRGVGGVLRHIPSRIMTPEELGLPKAVESLCALTKGLVLVTGPTGSGKSTTLATLVDIVNRTRRDHIITIEDPIEFVHENKRCLINQREVGPHTGSFKQALRAALREDPDIVLVGEMRDLETIAIAIETAVTGHLVFGTLHTSTAVQTVDRVIDQFPADRQPQIRTMLADCLRGVISQTLLPKRNGGRVAALEVLLGTASVSHLIREGKTFQVPSVMQTSRGMGMTTLNDVLLPLVRRRLVEPRYAYRAAVDKAGLCGLFERNGVKFDPGEGVEKEVATTEAVEAA